MNANSFADLAGIVEDLAEEIKSGTTKLVEKTAEYADKEAAKYFERAVYAGTNDVTTDHKLESDTEATVSAQGDAVAFIEFGTGLGPVEPPFVAGSYGKGHGAHPPWVYYGEQGNAPDTIDLGEHKGGHAILTFGNPANLCLHGARDKAEEAIPKLAKEVFDA